MRDMRLSGASDCVGCSAAPAAYSSVAYPPRSCGSPRGIVPRAGAGAAERATLRPAPALPSSALMPEPGLILAAGYFAIGGLVLAVLTGWFRRDLRGAIVMMLLAVIVGMGGLVLLTRYGGGIHSESMLAILRETALAILAIGVIRIAV